MNSADDMHRLTRDHHAARLRLLRWVTVGRMASAAGVGVILFGLMSERTPAVWAMIGTATVAGGLCALAGRTTRPAESEDFITLALSATPDRTDRMAVVSADVENINEYTKTVTTRLLAAGGVVLIGTIAVIGLS